MSHRHPARATVRATVRTVAVTLAAASTLALPTAAHADRSTTVDPAGDVLEISFANPESDDTPTFVPAPEVTAVDVTRTVVDHGKRRLRVVVDYQDLQRVAFHSTLVGIRTPRGRFQLSVDQETGARTKATLERPNGRTVKCRGLRWTFDDASDQVTATVPTSCIAGPRWVRVGVVGVMATFDGPVEDFDVHTYGDDSRRNGTLREQMTLGPKVRRG